MGCYPEKSISNFVWSSLHRPVEGIDHPTKITGIGKSVHTCEFYITLTDGACHTRKLKLELHGRAAKHLNNFEFNRRTLMSRNLCGYQMSLYRELLPVNKLVSRVIYWSSKIVFFFREKENFIPLLSLKS